MKSIWLTVASLLLLTFAGCAVIRTETPVRIALLAPFEGRYREIGYNALYPARLALADMTAAGSAVELLAVDDGGTPGSAADRARALANDPLVRAVIIIGYDAAAPVVLTAFADVPVVIVGEWTMPPQATDDAGHVFRLTHPAIAPRFSYTGRFDVTDPLPAAPFTGGDVLALVGFRRLHEDYRQRVLNSDAFAPEPGLLATTVYDAAGLLITATHSSDATREGIRQTLQSITYTGLNGEISFEGSYWRQAPINAFIINADGVLIRADDIVEQR